MEKTPEQSGEWKGKFFANEEEALEALKRELGNNDGPRAEILLKEIEEGVFSNDLGDFIDEMENHWQTLRTGVGQFESEKDKEHWVAEGDLREQMWMDFDELYIKRNNL